MKKSELRNIIKEEIKKILKIELGKEVKIIPKSIKELGEHQVETKLGSGISAKITLIIKAKETKK